MLEGLAGGHQAQPEAGSKGPRLAGGQHCDLCGKDLQQGLAGGHQAQPEDLREGIWWGTCGLDGHCLFKECIFQIPAH